MKPIKELLEMFHRGDALSDEELSRLLKVVNETVHGLENMSDRSYLLVTVDLWRIKESLEGYQKARKSKY